MKEDFVPFELAVKLKEKGFDIPFYFYYRTDDKLIHHAMVTKPLVYCDKIDDEVVCAPTISQVLKWLREEKCLHIEILHIFSEETLWDFEVAHIGSYERWWSNLELFDTYEQASIAGIEYALDNLI